MRTARLWTVLPSSAQWLFYCFHSGYSYFENHVAIKYHFRLVSCVQHIMTIKFFKAEFPKSLAVFQIREAGSFLDLCSDYTVVVVAAVLRESVSC